MDTVLTTFFVAIRQVMQFARCALGAIVFEGFGSTETTAICTTQIPGDLETGVVSSLSWVVSIIALNLVLLHGLVSV